MIKNRILFRSRYVVSLLIVVLLMAATIIPENPLYNLNWALLSTLIVLMGILTFFWHFEKKQVNSKTIALIATMSSLAAVSRIAFGAIASLQPATFIVMITGYVFGAQIGFMVGAIAALVSNFFLGQGPWTPWQMFCWGMCGVFASILSIKQEEFRLASFTALAGLCGFFYGWVINIWHWAAFMYPLNAKTFLAVYASSIVFDGIHAAGNIVFSVLFAGTFYQILRRFKKYI
ncbi:MAG: ECF transporter S component [Syntrophomonadaceae bacterium]|jgi:energy-coupling factor transport system substrate-specific component|nr:ECF transporter S component [Syntrophomonadaceae bacterium]